MSCNSPSGSYRTTKEKMMKAFDKLPPTSRAALANADHNWVPQLVLTQWRRGQPVQYLAILINHWDRLEHERDVKRGLVAPRAPSSKSKKSAP
jgi:hypothetical protein